MASFALSLTELFIVELLCLFCRCTYYTPILAFCKLGTMKKKNIAIAFNVDVFQLQQKSAGQGITPCPTHVTNHGDKNYAVTSSNGGWSYTSIRDTLDFDTVRSSFASFSILM